jgi:hypothetical protein
LPVPVSPVIEHREVELGHALELREHLAHRDGAPHEVVEAVVAC